MKTTVLVTCLFVTEVFSQGGFNNLRIPNLFSSGGNSGFSFSNLFRPNNNRQRQQRPQDGSSVQPFLSPPAPSTQIQTFLPQQPQNLPPLFNPQASQPVITNPQAVIPPQPLPLENSRQPIPFQQQAVQPPQQPQFPVQQQVNPNFLQGVQQFRPETGFTPVSPQIIGARQPVSLQPSFAGTAGVKQVFSPIENEIITRPDPTRGIGNFQDLRRRPSLKEKAYLDCGPGNDLGFCAVSEKYPGVHIDKLMEKCRPEVIKMFVEVPEEHETLVDTVLGPSVLKNLSNGKDVEAPTWSWAAYKKESACDAERRTINPGIASDKNGKWMVIVQTNDMPQRIHTEVCRNQGGACKAMSDCGKNSRCTQKYSWHLLIAMDQDEPDSCPRMAAFRFPTSCVCHIEIDKPRLLRSPPMSKKVDYHEDYEVIESEESLRADI